MRNVIAITFFVLVIMSSVNADVVIREWKVNDTNKWQRFGDSHIRILLSDEDIFSFEAYDSVSGDEVDIDLIETDPAGVIGTVRVRVAADPYHPERTYGAATIKQIDLSSATSGGISGLNISGDLAKEGDVLCDWINGEVTVPGSFGDGPGDTTFDLKASASTNTNIVHTLNIGTLYGDIKATNIHNVNLTNTGAQYGSITSTSTGGFEHTITIGREVGYFGS